MRNPKIGSFFQFQLKDWVLRDQNMILTYFFSWESIYSLLGMRNPKVGSFSKFHLFVVMFDLIVQNMSKSSFDPPESSQVKYDFREMEL